LATLEKNGNGKQKAATKIHQTYFSQSFVSMSIFNYSQHNPWIK